jgi:hypothetical protein
LAAILPASSSPSARTARPVTRISVGSPERSTRAASTTTSGAGGSGLAGGGTGTGPEPSFQAVSAGRISVAICPGGMLAAAIAAAPSAAMPCASGEVLTQCDDGRANPSMSEVSGASYCR